MLFPAAVISRGGGKKRRNARKEKEAGRHHVTEFTAEEIKKSRGDLEGGAERGKRESARVSAVALDNGE